VPPGGTHRLPIDDRDDDLAPAGDLVLLQEVLRKEEAFEHIGAAVWGSDARARPAVDGRTKCILRRREPLHQVRVQLEGNERDARAAAWAFELICSDDGVEQVVERSIAADLVILLGGVKQDHDVVRCATGRVRRWWALATAIL
jgi:hypothetical protein